MNECYYFRRVWNLRWVLSVCLCVRVSLYGSIGLKEFQCFTEVIKAYDNSSYAYETKTNPQLQNEFRLTVRV